MAGVKISVRWRRKSECQLKSKHVASISGHSLWVRARLQSTRFALLGGDAGWVKQKKEDMRILTLQAENLKKLKVVDITPDAHMQAITGKNASGKSSILDAIYYALAGKEAICEKPIRNGCEKAKIRLNLGTIAVERKFNASGSTTVSVTNEDGSTWKSPQAMLDALLGELTFDPLGFARSKPKEQRDVIRKIAKISLDIDALNAANEADFKRRTDINREAKQKRTTADAIIVSENTPTEPISETAILDKMQQAGEFNADIERRKLNRQRAAQDVEDLRREYVNILGQINPSIEAANNKIADLNRQIAAAEQERDSATALLNRQADEKLAAAEDLKKKLASAGELPEPISITNLRVDLDGARFTNALIEKRKQRDLVVGEADALEQHARILTDAMTTREKQIEDAIKAAEMPVDGLGFGADCVTYLGVPFSQASSAEQLRVSVSIAMAANPKLRVIRIQDGSLLDDEGMAMISEMAKEKDFQVWLEVVDTTGKVGIFMEDGEVKAVNA